MKIDITDIAYASRLNIEDKDTEYDIILWLEKSNGQIFHTEILINFFGYRDIEEIEQSGWFIPIVKKDPTPIKKDFIENYRNRKITDKMKDIINNEDIGFCYDFPIEIALMEDDCPEYIDFAWEYHDYEKARLVEDAKEWCKNNGILWYDNFDPDLKLEITNAINWSIYYYSNDEYVCDDCLLDKIDFHFVHFRDAKRNTRLSGFTSIEDAIKSGRFVKFIKQDVFELQKEFIFRYKKDVFNQKKNKTFFSKKTSKIYDSIFDLLVTNESISEEWDKYFKSRMREIIEEWCKRNNIPFYYAKERPDHLGSKIKNNG